MSSYLCNRTLADEGILVLGIIRKDKRYIGSPKADTVIHPADTLILYGRISNMSSLDKRKKDIRGDREHEAAVKEQTKVTDLEE